MIRGVDRFPHPDAVMVLPADVPGPRTTAASAGGPAHRGRPPGRRRGSRTPPASGGPASGAAASAGDTARTWPSTLTNVVAGCACRTRSWLRGDKGASCGLQNTRSGRPANQGLWWRIESSRTRMYSANASFATVATTQRSRPSGRRRGRLRRRTARRQRAPESQGHSVRDQVGVEGVETMSGGPRSPRGLGPHLAEVVAPPGAARPRPAIPSHGFVRRLHCRRQCRTSLRRDAARAGGCQPAAPSS